MRLRRVGGAVLSSRAAPHPHPLRHAVSAAFARLASSRFASLARSALRALESPLREGRAPSRPGVLDFVRNIFSALLSTSPTVLVHCRWAEVRGRRSGRRELARRRAPPGGARRGGCGCGAARDDSIAPHPRRRRPPRAPRRPAISAGAGARRPLRRPRARREARPISGKKRKGRAKARGRRSGRGRRQSGDCRDPVTQAATRAFARALERRKSDAPTLRTDGW